MENTQVLEFTLGSEQYCLDLSHVAEIVERGSLTELPNTPRYVEGVMDLRGETTTIINPKTALHVSDDSTTASQIIVLRMEDGKSIGWLVDEARQVREVSPEQVDDETDADAVNGVVHDNDEFVIWVDPANPQLSA